MISALPLRAATMEFSPNLAFRLMKPASEKRKWARWAKFRNYKERAGSPVQYCADAYANEEIRALRIHFMRLIAFMRLVPSANGNGHREESELTPQQ